MRLRTGLLLAVALPLAGCAGERVDPTRALVEPRPLPGREESPLAATARAAAAARPVQLAAATDLSPEDRVAARAPIELAQADETGVRRRPGQDDETLQRPEGIEPRPPAPVGGGGPRPRLRIPERERAGDVEAGPAGPASPSADGVPGRRRVEEGPAPGGLPPIADLPPQPDRAPFLFEDLDVVRADRNSFGLGDLGRAAEIPLPDRWRIVDAIAGPLDGSIAYGFRYDVLDPYNQNILKGDRPLFDDWFFLVNVISDTVIEPRSTPLPIGIQATARPNSNDSFGNVDQLVLNQSLLINLNFIKGNTAYKPPFYEFRFTPVLNYSYVETDEVRILFADPAQGTDRYDFHIGIQELFLDYHIRDVSARYDFDSIRVGIQPFNSDFRGFLFQDNQFGVRLFGSRANNVFQYNLAWFRRMDKDINSGLNHIGKALRDDDVFIANLYWQDLFALGLTTQFTAAYNRNRENREFLFDANRFLQRPASLGNERLRSYDVYYLGGTVDGRFERFNIDATFYYAFGEDDVNQFTGRPADISAFFLAVEPSIDFSWARFRGSFVFQSGDEDPFDDDQEGFDAIFENPQIAGSDTSYFIRQPIPLIQGGGVQLTGRNALLVNLRSSKEQGQSNFNNPGLTLVGVGADFDLTPEFRLSANVNRLWFNDTSSLQFLRQQGDIDTDIGWDVSAATIYRPLFIQNIVFRLSGAALFTGEGFEQIYDSRDGEDILYSVLGNVILTY